MIKIDSLLAINVIDTARLDSITQLLSNNNDYLENIILIAEKPDNSFILQVIAAALMVISVGLMILQSYITKKNAEAQSDEVKNLTSNMGTNFDNLINKTTTNFENIIDRNTNNFNSAIKQQNMMHLANIVERKKNKIDEYLTNIEGDIPSLIDHRKQNRGRLSLSTQTNNEIINRKYEKYEMVQNTVKSNLNHLKKYVNRICVIDDVSVNDKYFDDVEIKIKDHKIIDETEINTSLSNLSTYLNRVTIREN